MSNIGTSVEWFITKPKDISILSQSFIYNGEQVFTLNFAPTNILSVSLNGQILNGVPPVNVQYTFENDQLTVLDTLQPGDKIWIWYIHSVNDTASYTKSESNALLSKAITIPYLGSIGPTDAPTGLGRAYWMTTESGTYVHFNGIVINENSFAIISRDENGNFSVKQTSIDISDYATSQYFKKVFVKTYESFDDVTHIPVRQDTTSTFSGWECAVGMPQNFQKARFKVRVRANVVNTIKCRIYDYDTSTVLAETTLTNLALTPLTIHELTVDFGEVIANVASHKIMFGYLCDQLIDRIGIMDGTIYPSPAYPATKYAVNGSQNFATMTSSNNTRLNFIEFLSPDGYSPVIALADNLRQYLPELEEATETKVDFSQAVEIVKGIDGTENFPIANAAWRDTTSIFSGWGTSIGVRKNFNALLFKLKARSTAITSIYYELRETNKAGQILASGYLPVNIPTVTERDITISLPLIENLSNAVLWFGFQANQLCDLFGHIDGVLPNIGNAAYRTNGNQTPGTWSDISSGDRNIWIKTGSLLKFPYPTDQFVAAIAEKLAINPEVATADLVVPDEIYGVEAIENNIFFKNAVIPPFGVSDNQFTVDITGTKGAQYNRNWKYKPNATDAGIHSLQVDVRSKREIVASKTILLKIAAKTAGIGVNRKLLIIGDSTVDGEDITIPLKAHFDSDVMGLTFIGTRGSAGLKHEGRGGWTFNDYATAGRTYYKFNVSGLANLPGLGSVYSNNGSQYTVEEINITDGNGYFSTTKSSGSNNPLATGNLIRVSGIGDNSIAYTSSEIISGNPFWNPTTSQFDFQMYLSNTGQTMTAGDIVSFQLGINDVFGISSLTAADIKTAMMWTQLKGMMDNIQSAIPGIRIGVLLVLPPAGSQDAFAVNYNNGQTREMYLKTGWLTWNKKLLAEYDTPDNRALDRYVIGASLNLDPDYGFPTSSVYANARSNQLLTIQSNAVHPSVSGNLQIADSYIGLIKYLQ